MKPDSITPEMAKRAALKHLKGIYYHGTVEANEAILEDSATPVYRVSGVINPRSRNLLSRFTEPHWPYYFTAHVDANEGKLLDYEVV